MADAAAAASAAPADATASAATAAPPPLPPFHLAFPVHDIAAARHFYGEVLVSDQLFGVFLVEVQGFFLDV